MPHVSWIFLARSSEHGTGSKVTMRSLEMMDALDSGSVIDKRRMPRVAGPYNVLRNIDVDDAHTC